MSRDRDPIAMVEACYDLRASETDWLQGVAHTARPLLKVDDLLAYHVDRTGDGFRFVSTSETNGDRGSFDCRRA